MGDRHRTSATWIISTKSGAGDANDFFESSVLSATQLPGHLRPDGTASCVRTDSRVFIENYTFNTILREAQKGIETEYVLLSGDGGPADVINVLLRRPDHEGYVPPTIGLLPFGTGNALANSYGINEDDTRGLSTLATGTARLLPTFRVTVSPGSQLIISEGREQTSVIPKEYGDQQPGEPAVIYGAVVCSWGLHASLVADSDTQEYRKHGDQRFYMAAKELLMPSSGSESHRYKGKVWIIRRRTDGEEGEQRILLDRTEHMYALVTMVSHLQKGFRISPDSKPLDGKLRLVHFGVMAPERVMHIMGLAADGGKHVLEDDVDYEEIEGLRIELLEEEERWRRICVDGKIIQIQKGGWMEVRRETRESVKLIIPQAFHSSGPE